MAEVKYKRVLLKLSGESLCKVGGFGIDSEAIEPVAKRIAKICKLGVDVAIVVGGGNFLRGGDVCEQEHSEAYRRLYGDDGDCDERCGFA